VISTHLKAVRDWHNAHPFDSVPAGTNPATGKPLGNLDRQMIADGRYRRPCTSADDRAPGESHAGAG